MEKKKISFRLFFINISGMLLVTLVMITLVHSIRTNEFQTYERLWNIHIKTISALFSLYIRTQIADLNAYIRVKEFEIIEKNNSINDLYFVSERGQILEVIKNQFAYRATKDFNIAASPIYRFVQENPYGHTASFGPYLSDLSHKMVFSLIRREKGGFYLADINMEIIENKMYQIQSNDMFYLLMTTKDNKPLYLFGDPEKHIEVEQLASLLGGSSILLDGKRFEHRQCYNTDLNITIHFLFPVTTLLLDSENAFLLDMMILVCSMAIFIIVLLTQRSLFLFPIRQMIRSISEWDSVSLKPIQEFKYFEFEVLRKKYMELVGRIDAEIAIEKQIKDYYDNIIHSFPNIMISTDIDENIVMINKMGSRFFEIYSMEDAKRRIQQYIPFSDIEKEMVRRLKSAPGASDVILKKEIMKADDEFVFDIYIYSLNDASEVIGLVFVLIDVTDKKYIEEQILQTQKLETISILANGFAHEFNNLLAVILGNLDLYPYAKTDEKREQIIQSIRDSGTTASELIRQILVFSDKEKVEEESVDIESALKHTVKMSRKSLPTEIQVIERYNATGAQALGNYNQLMQVFINLILNARDALDEIPSPQIEIVSERIFLDNNQIARYGLNFAGHYIRITICDNGPEINWSIQDKIFDPFFSTKERGSKKGVGMGLAIVYSVIKRFQGSIINECILNKGCAFHIFLPENSVSKTHLAASQAIDRKAGYVLIVEDDASVTSLAEKTLTQYGYRTQNAHNAVSAVDKIKKEMPSFIVLDVMLPDYGGEYVLNFLQETKLNIPVLIVSGYFEKLDRNAYLRFSNVVDFLEKPFTLSRLIELVKESLTTS